MIEMRLMLKVQENYRENIEQKGLRIKGVHLVGTCVILASLINPFMPMLHLKTESLKEKIGIYLKQLVLYHFRCMF